MACYLCRSRLAGEEAPESCTALKDAFAGKPAPTAVRYRCCSCRGRLAGEQLLEPCTALGRGFFTVG
ncbi:hypothetical protein C1883_20790 [Pseudomonas protegens]|nr:hypothetical protein C1883_20790 [Pseudomonas protegens]